MKLRAALSRLSNLRETFYRCKYRFWDVHRMPTGAMRKRAAALRRKAVVRVAFIVYDPAKWKLEPLYVQMRAHPRFEPVLVAAMIFGGDDAENARLFMRCTDFLRSRGYPFVPASPLTDIDGLVHPDVVFYGEPYPIFSRGYQLSADVRRASLGCYVPYDFYNSSLQKTRRLPALNLAWLFCVESEAVRAEFSGALLNGGRNLVVTGSPVQDMFLGATGEAGDRAWKPQVAAKKRVIWAPSHTLPGNRYNIYGQSTFLDFAEPMLALAEKYRDRIQWAFKPHPVLKRKLAEEWGAARTEAYYARWAEMDAGQLEEGGYVDLFAGSDALLHDGRSFLLEYLFTSNPVLFLDDGADKSAAFNATLREAYDLHEKARTPEEVEAFLVRRVLGGDDPLRERREAFRQSRLVPPNGRTASQNIIDAILGEGAYGG